MLQEYIDLCRCIGSWPDWVQGPGGNCSIKEDNRLLVKRSGALIADTTEEKGWVLCDSRRINEALVAGEEDISSCVMEGSGKPSIEAFLHTFPSRIIVHLHPAPLMNLLCSDSIESLHYEEIPNRIIPYCKPGIPLTHALQKVYDPSIPLYFLKNHGVILMANTVAEILSMMMRLREDLFDKQQLSTNICLASTLYRLIHTLTGKRLLVRPYLQLNVRSRERIFFPYSPDIAVFLQKAALVIENPQTDYETYLQDYIKTYGTLPSVIGTSNAIYIIGSSIEACSSTYEILMAYYTIPVGSTHLTETDYSELVNWDKEKARRQEDMKKA